MMNPSGPRPIFSTALWPPFYGPQFVDFGPYPSQTLPVSYVLPTGHYPYSPFIGKSEKHGPGVLTYASTYIYNSLMLFLPYFYRSRLHQVLRGVRLTRTELNSLATGAPPGEYVTPKCWDEVKRCWSEFLDSVLQEWKTLNIVSALLLTAIYNVLQLGGYGNRVVRCTALMALVSALMSLIFGCLYVIRFETMRRPYKAMEWASDILSSSRAVFWNVYILLALPSIWLAWSLILFLICLMTIVWQPEDLAPHTNGVGPLPLSVKIAVSALLFVGFVQLLFILGTFFRYGGVYDKRWANHLNNLMNASPPNPINDNYARSDTSETRRSGRYHSRRSSVSISDYHIPHSTAVHYAPHTAYHTTRGYDTYHPNSSDSTADYYSIPDMSYMVSSATLPQGYFHQNHVPNYLQAPLPTVVPIETPPRPRSGSRSGAINRAPYEEAPLPPGFQYPAPLGHQVPSTNVGSRQSPRDDPREWRDQVIASRLSNISEESLREISPRGSRNAILAADEGDPSTRPQGEEAETRAEQT